jgi:hypothetical protein
MTARLRITPTAVASAAYSGISKLISTWLCAQLLDLLPDHSAAVRHTSKSAR